MVEVANVDVSRYTSIVQWSPEDESYVASHPEIPDCLGVGDTPEIATALLEEATAAWLESAAERGATVPAPMEDRYSGKFLVRVSPSLHRALAVRAIAERVSLNKLVLQLLSAGLTSQPSTAVLQTVVTKFEASDEAADEPA